MVELDLLCSNQDDEIVSNALMELGALSVSLEDANAFTDEEQELFAEPGMDVEQKWLHGKISALFNSQQQARQAWRVLVEHALIDNTDPPVIRVVEQQDWVRLTQAQFSPVEICPDFWIVPSWSTQPQQAEKVIQLDPGLAFGTGTHPTTKMCLRWLAANVKAGAKVLDYGCGSGILAIAAAKFAAREVVAVDIDAAAIVAAQDNASKNMVQLKIGQPEIVTGKFDIVVANILAMPLKVLAPLLVSHLAKGASLVLSGILARQQQELIQAYANLIKLEVVDTEEGWILLVAKNYC